MTQLRTPVARQQISNTHQWTNCGTVFSMRTVRQLRDATIELLNGVLCAVHVMML
jgi:hypothetical protein